MKTRKGVGLISDRRFIGRIFLFGEAGAKKAGLLRRVRGGEQQISVQISSSKEIFPFSKPIHYWPTHCQSGRHFLQAI